MNLATFIVFIPTFIAKICLAGLIINTSKLEESRLVEASIDILAACYTNHSSTVGLAGPMAGRIMTRISSRDAVISVTLIDEALTSKSHDPIDRGSRYKLQVFVITVTNSSNLVRTLTQVRQSKWWNHMASFLLIDLPVEGNGCLKAYETLWEAWKMNLLNAKFLCFHRTRSQLIYTFNPYAGKAPAPWQQENTYKGVDGHIWTLFVRKYREDESRCDGLDYDKTIDLGGYEVRASVMGMEKWWYTDPDKKPLLLDRVQNITAQILMTSLNATWKLLRERWNPRPILYNTTRTFGIAAEIRHGISDICFNIFVQHMVGRFETTYPVHQFYLAVATQYPGYKSQLNKIISVLDRSSRFGVVVVFVLTLLFFKLWLGKPLVVAILDMVLLLCNAALRKIPDKVAPRIYLCALFIFVVTIQGIYQGKLASLLTKDVRLPVVNSIEDLVRSYHTIYGQPEYQVFFNESAFEGRYVATDGFCPLVYDAKAACVNIVVSIISGAARFRLHLSRETMGVINGVYLIRRDWPLEERVNVIFGRAVAAGIVEVLYSRERDSELNIIRSYENQEEEPEVKVITLANLGFAFVILGIGLGCATIILIIEVAINSKALKNIRRTENKLN